MAYEPKWDGHRIAVHVPGEMIHTRRGADVTARFPELLAAARELGGAPVLDGELVAYRQGIGLDFAALGYGRARRIAEQVNLFYVAFDIIGYRGRDLRDQPYEQRRRRLETILTAGGSPMVQLITATRDRALAARWLGADQATFGLEGIVCKPLASRYPKRGGAAGWTKIRYYDDLDAVIIGFLGPLQSPTALVLGQEAADGKMHSIGLSTTLSRRVTAALTGRLRPLPARRRAAGLLAGLPGTPDFFFTPVRPEVVVEVRADGAREFHRFRHRLAITKVKSAE